MPLSPERRDEAISHYVDLPLARHGHLALLPHVLELGRIDRTGSSCPLARPDCPATSRARTRLSRPSRTCRTPRSRLSGGRLRASGAVARKIRG
jgi:hypothetical protein